IELPLVHLLQHRADRRAWLLAEREQVTSEHNRGRRLVLDAKVPCALEEPLHRGAIEGAAAAAAVRPPDQHQQLHVHLRRQAPERAVADIFADLVPGAWLQMLRDDAEDLTADVDAV